MPEAATASPPPFAVPDFPLLIPDGAGGWSKHDGVGALTTAQVAAWVQWELARCASDRLHFLTHWCCTVDEQREVEQSEQPRVAPFPDWPHVRALVDAMSIPPRNIVISKSRRMLGTWTLMGCALHDLLFQRNWTILTLSRVEGLVDDGGERSTWSSLHGKIRFMYNHLPPFLLGAHLSFKYLMVANYKQNNVVHGFASSASPGRSAGFNRAILDEFAHVANSEQIMASVGPACPRGKVLLSTPLGMGNAFARIYHQDAYDLFPKHGEPARPHQWGRILLHYTSHPLRADGRWIKHEIESQAMTAEKIAQEYENDFLGARGRRVYPKYSEDKHLVGGTLCDYQAQYDPQRALCVCCDFNYDPLVWGLVQIWNSGPRYRVIGELCLRDATVNDAVSELIARFCPQGPLDTLRAADYDWGRKFRYVARPAGPSGHQGPLIIYGDATEQKSTVHNREKTYNEMRAKLKDWAAVLPDGKRPVGLGGFREVHMKVPPANPPVARRHELVNDVLSRDLMILDPTAEQLRKDFLNGCWDKVQKDMDQKTEDDDGSHLTRSHASSAFGYMVCATHKVASSSGAVSRRPGQQGPRDMAQEFIQSWNSPTGRRG